VQSDFVLLHAIKCKSLAGLRANGQPAFCNISHSPYEKVRGAAFGDVPFGPRTKRLKGVSSAAVHCEHEDARMSVQLTDMIDCIDATTAWHRNIHDDNIRPRILETLVGGRGIAGLTDDL
jgi:hypothetical protein